MAAESVNLVVLLGSGVLSAAAVAASAVAIVWTRDATPQKLGRLVDSLRNEVAEFRSGHEAREMRMGELTNGVLAQIATLEEMIENLEQSARKKKNAANRLESLQGGTNGATPTDSREAAREFFRQRGLPA